MRLVPFNGRKFNSNTYIIEDAHGGSCNYLLLGENKALLIDTGISDDDMRTFVETLTDLPVTVVCTHGHLDHIGCNRLFDEVYMSKLAKVDAQLTYNKKKAMGLTGNYEINEIEEGYVFDIGGRHIEAISIPCHSPGDMAFLDRESRIIFTGDNLESGQVLLFYGDDRIGASVKRHLEIMQKLKSRESEYDIICPAHNGSPLDKCYVDWFIENDEMVLNGKEGDACLFSPTFRNEPHWHLHEEFVRCSFHKGTSIVYDIRRVDKTEGLYAVGTGEI